MNNFNLVNKGEIINRLKNSSDVFSKYNIEVWVKEQENYNINIFTVLLENNIQLSESWEVITNSIAVHFQSLLEKDIEIWNIYVLFLVKSKVDKELKFRIEQDKYSSRKIVCDDFKDGKNEHPNDQIKKVIDNKLFGFRLSELAMDSQEFTVQHNIEEMIKQKDTRLYQIIKYANNNKDAAPEKLFDIYMEGDE